MALQSTTNLQGTVASDSTVALVISIASTPKNAVIYIGGTGNARFAVNTTNSDLTTDSVIAGGGAPGIAQSPIGVSKILLYANGSESTLTYAISRSKPIEMP